MMVYVNVILVGGDYGVLALACGLVDLEDFFF